MTEHDQQAQLIQWSRWRNDHPALARLFAIPNGAKLPWRKDSSGRRYSPEAQRLKAEGLTAGVPDLMLPYPARNLHGLFIELKYGRNKPSQEQVAMIDYLATVGYAAIACWSAAEAAGAICDYLSIPPDDFCQAGKWF